MRMAAMLALAVGLCALEGPAQAQTGATYYSDKPMSVGELEAFFNAKPGPNASAGEPAATRRPKVRAPTITFGGETATPAASPAATATGATATGAGGSSAPPAGRSLSIPVQFALNSDQIAPTFGPQLQSIGQMLQAHRDWTFVVIGHTDSTGDASHNQALSGRRAEAVRRSLISWGASPAQVMAVGRGANAPLEGEPADSSRQRRVEFVRAG